MIVASAFALTAVFSFAADTPATDSSPSMTEKIKELPEKAKDMMKSKFSKADKDHDGTLDK